MNGLSEIYIEACTTEHSPLRSVMRKATLPPNFRKAFGRNLLPRPWFLPESDLRDIADDLGQLLELMADLPRRLFDGDFIRYHLALGIDERRSALLRRCATAQPVRIGRADVYYDGTSFRLLEFNIGADVGGMDMAEVNRALMTVPAFHAFAEEYQLDYVDTGAEVVSLLLSVAEPIAGGREPIVAVIDDPGGLAKYGHYFRSLQEVARRFGLTLLIGEIGGVRTRNGKVVLDGMPIDVLMRNFLPDQILADPSGEEAVEPLFRAHEMGKTILFTTLESCSYDSKANLALLSDPRWRAAFSSEESALIDRILPWTRSVDGTDVDLIKQCRDRREELILKPCWGYSGMGIVAGWEVNDREWQGALATRVKGGCIVQQRIVPESEPVCDPNSGDIQYWKATLGVFLADGRYAGACARALPSTDGAIIAYFTNARTLTTGVFSYPNEYDE